MITIRTWNLSDVGFMLQCRNNPRLMRWYRQDKKLSSTQQKKFMSMADSNSYFGYIVETGIDKPIGFVALSHVEPNSAEFSIGILPKYQGLGYAKDAMQRLEDLATASGISRIYSEVFIDNPALGFYLSRGYKPTKVKERAYYKKNIGLVDVVFIEKQLC